METRKILAFYQNSWSQPSEFLIPGWSENWRRLCFINMISTNYLLELGKLGGMCLVSGSYLISPCAKPQNQVKVLKIPSFISYWSVLTYWYLHTHGCRKVWWQGASQNFPMVWFLFGFGIGSAGVVLWGAAPYTHPPPPYITTVKSCKIIFRQSDIKTELGLNIDHLPSFEKGQAVGGFEKTQVHIRHSASSPFWQHHYQSSSISFAENVIIHCIEPISWNVHDLAPLLAPTGAL